MVEKYTRKTEDSPEHHLSCCRLDIFLQCHSDSKEYILVAENPSMRMDWVELSARL